jgi:putative membrane-bound dehydrogenase-like protein
MFPQTLQLRRLIAATLLTAFSLHTGSSPRTGALAADPPEEIELPRVFDEALEISLVADSNQIVHPIGVAFTSDGRLLAIESHTHFPPDGYDGLKRDRILSLSDSDGDGTLDEVVTFFEGTKFSMDIAVHFDGSVYLATRNEILRLRDDDNDGKAETSERIAFLETTGNYPHNGLSGLHIDFDGNLHFGMGENLGVVYRLIGSDGREITDEGEGGNVFWCRADGSGLRRVATGFWNPFGVCRDLMGNLFAIDNDPSANGCRLLHVIEGGNYGYQYRYGRTGLHPFVSWRGELPGTLPMVCPTGEAPCELICYQANGLPSTYRGTLLSACWSEHQIQQYRLAANGASFRAERSVVVQGGQEFRPVGIAVAHDGSLFISDWVKRDYKLHGHGRIWHLRPKQPTPKSKSHDMAHNRSMREAEARRLVATKDVDELKSWLRPGSNLETAATAVEALAALPAGRVFLEEFVADQKMHPSLRALGIRRMVSLGHKLEMSKLALDSRELPPVQLAAIGTIKSPAHVEAMLATIVGDDAFLRSATVSQFAKHADLLEALPTTHASSVVRIHRLLAIRLAVAAGESDEHRRPSLHPMARAALRDALQDKAPGVQFAALKWIADERLEAYAANVQDILLQADVAPNVFFAAATAQARLDGQSGDERSVLAQLIPNLGNADIVSDAKIMILRGVSAPGEIGRSDQDKVPAAVLAGLLESNDVGLVRETVRFLAAGADEDFANSLARIAADESNGLELRRDAVLGLAPQAARFKKSLLRWAESSELQADALRALTGTELTPQDVEQLKSTARTDDAKQAVQRLLRQPIRAAAQSDDIAHWVRVVGQPGDFESGRRVFLNSKLAKCSSCHQSGGRGSDIGPDLTDVARQSNLQQLVESIVRPSQNVAPHYSAWRIVTADGKSRTAFLVSQTEQDQTFVDEQGKQFTLKNEDVEVAEPLRQSIMPTGLPALLTDQEMRDLFAFLTARSADVR